jgi:drug/metabolite transporter (DMT)-like permease
MASGANKVMGPAEWLLLLVLAMLWGGSFFFAKIALAELHPFTLVLGRVGLAALALNLAAYASGHRMPTAFGPWRAFLVMGALNNLLPFSLIFWGQTEIASSLAAILNATTPLFAVVLAHFLTRDERMTVERLSGVLLGVCGVVVMIGPEALAGLSLHVLAQIAVLAAALSYACAGIFGRRFAGTPPLIAAAGQLTGTTLMMLPLALLIDRPWTLPAPTLGTWGALAALALLSTAAAYVIYFRILAAAGATNLLLVTFLIPPSALLLGATFLDERLDHGAFIGMALIALGLAAIDGRPLARLRARLRAHP